MRRNSLELWRRRYGLRWIAESVFSWMKRVFGEYVTAKKLENMVKEITLKIFLYNIFIRMRKNSLRRERSEQIQIGKKGRRHIFIQQSKIYYNLYSSST